ncbi:UNVERIFIED_CONTAM: hypothetical protein GTU68_030645 [Idotea baltica]|nr:hypothetical protein [Idotea baltica]
MGLVMAVASSLMFSLCSLLVKVLEEVPSTELAVFRFVGVLLPTLPLVIARGDTLFPKGQRCILILRGIFGTTSLLLQFYAFQHLALGDASVIVFSAPVFVALFARIFLKEACGLFQASLILLTLAGVTLITRPPWLFGHLSDTYTPSEWKGAMAAFLGTIVAANVYVMLRVLKNLHYSVVLLDFAVVALFITPTVTFASTQGCVPPCGSRRWMIIAIGILSFLGQVLKTKALQLEEAGPVAIARTADVIFAFIWQFLFFGETPDTLTVLGTLYGDLQLSCSSGFGDGSCPGPRILRSGENCLALLVIFP